MLDTGANISMIHAHLARELSMNITDFVIPVLFNGTAATPPQPTRKDKNQVYLMIMNFYKYQNIRESVFIN